MQTMKDGDFMAGVDGTCYVSHHRALTQSQGNIGITVIATCLKALLLLTPCLGMFWTAVGICKGMAGT